MVLGGVCGGGWAVIAATNPPCSPGARLENWKSHFISEERKGWELGGVGKQRR